MSDAPGDAARDAAAEAKERVTEQAVEVREATRGRLMDQLDTRSTRAGEQVTSTASAVRGMSDQLRSQGQTAAARVSDEVADRMERAGSYLRGSDADEIVRDVEDFTRRQPWLVIAAGVVLGIAGARFLKASSRGRYRPAASRPTRPAWDAPDEPAPPPPVARRDVDEALAGVPDRPATGRGETM
jgi:ElaB/YqjD/DUF883 family membrane-anchored ribosome-binding protein